MTTTTPKTTCTDPARWPRPPAADAPDAEIRAYLRHCDTCAYHTALEDDPAFDAYLRQASRDLVVPPAARPPRPFARRRSERPPAAPTLADRAGYERRLMHACLAAFCIVVLSMALQTTLFDAAAPEATLAETALVPAAPGRLAMTLATGRPFVARLSSEQELAEDVADGAFAVNAAGVRVGSRLLVTNPLTGAAVEAVAVEGEVAEGEIVLSEGAARTLGFEGRAVVVVEILAEPAAPMFGP